MFSMSLRLADHVREYSVSARQGGGWEVKLQEDRTLKGTSGTETGIEWSGRS
jgi:hypothetical protein